MLSNNESRITTSELISDVYDHWYVVKSDKIEISQLILWILLPTTQSELCKSYSNTWSIVVRLLRASRSITCTSFLTSCIHVISIRGDMIKRWNAVYILQWSENISMIQKYHLPRQVATIKDLFAEFFWHYEMSPNLFSLAMLYLLI